MLPANSKRAGRPVTAQPDCLVNARAAAVPSLLWDERSKRVFWVDAPSGRVAAVSLVSGVQHAWSLPCPVSTIALCGDDRLLAVLADGAYLFDLCTHDLHFLAALSGPLPPGAVGPDGRLWIAGGDGRITRLHSDGRVSGLEVDETDPMSGLSWSADGRSLYASGGVWSFEPEAVSLVRRSHFPVVREAAGGAIDAEGAYWRCAPACIERLAPDGELLQSVRLPVPLPSACCFAGPDLKLLLIASSRDGLAERDALQHTLSGGLFMLPVAVPGLRVRRFPAA